NTPLFGGEERPGSLELHGIDSLTEFRLEAGLPVWRYEVDGFAFEKRMLLPHLQNTVHVNYRLADGEGTIRLKLRPSVHFRPHEAPVSEQHAGPYTLTCIDGRLELSDRSGRPPLRVYLLGGGPAFPMEPKELPDILYRVEQSRGYEALGALWSPGYFRVDLSGTHEATLVASTEPGEAILALRPPEAFRAERERRSRLVAAARPEV